jgi:hypothetical protein
MQQEHEYYYPREVRAGNTPAAPRHFKRASNRTAVRATVMNDTDLKKMLGILIVLLIVVFFTVFINIVITLMKPSCKCPPFMYPQFPQAPY